MFKFRLIWYSANIPAGVLRRNYTRSDQNADGVCEQTTSLHMIPPVLKLVPKYEKRNI